MTEVFGIVINVPVEVVVIAALLVGVAIGGGAGLLRRR